MNKYQKNAARILRKLNKNGPPFRLKDGTFGSCRRDGSVGSGCALTAMAMLDDPSADLFAHYDSRMICSLKVRLKCEGIIGRNQIGPVIQAFDSRANEESAESCRPYRLTKSHVGRLALILKNIAKYGRAFPTPRQLRKAAKCSS